MRRLFKISWTFLVLAIVLLPVQAQDAPRLQIGLQLLPAVIAANTRLAATSKSEVLPIYLVYRENARQAEQLRPGVEKLSNIREHPLKVQVISVDELLSVEPSPISAIFLTEPMGDRLGELVQFAADQRVLLFSPFKGDVERGVSAGFRVTDKVLPLINKGALEDSKIKLKAFFLRIAVIHE